MKKHLLFLMLAFGFFFCIGCHTQKTISSSSKPNGEMNKTYDPTPLYVIYKSGLLDSLSCPCNNELAITIYEQRISMLNEQLQSGSIDNRRLNEIIIVFNNFELLTGIESDADGNFLGKWIPTLNDVDRWSEWLKDNKQNLCWYSKEGILYLKR